MEERSQQGIKWCAGWLIFIQKFNSEQRTLSLHFKAAVGKFVKIHNIYQPKGLCTPSLYFSDALFKIHHLIKITETLHAESDAFNYYYEKIYNTRHKQWLRMILWIPHLSDAPAAPHAAVFLSPAPSLSSRGCHLSAWSCIWHRGYLKGLSCLHTVSVPFCLCAVLILYFIPHLITIIHLNIWPFKSIGYLLTMLLWCGKKTYKLQVYLYM